MSDVYIIARPVGGRKYQYWHGGFSPAWRTLPDEAYFHQDKSSAENRLKNNETGEFRPDDFIRPLRDYDGKHCQFCASPHIRIEGTAIEHPGVTLDVVCNACNARWQVLYTCEEFKWT